MKKTITPNYTDYPEAIKCFLKELPEANAHLKSSIFETFRIAGEEVQLHAYKTHGMNGWIWNVGIQR